MPVAPDAKTVFSLYRVFHRQIRLLPTNYLRQFFKLKLGDDARAVLETYDTRRRATKMRRVQAELKRLRLANRGVWEKFDHVLDLAYGRKGKLRWELLQPIMSDPASPRPDRIIPSVERSRPPVISPELTALMINEVSHKNRAIPLPRVRRPFLPKRADRLSDEARLLGPLSKRREVNIRWRFFSRQLRFIYPPLEVGVEQGSTLPPQDRRIDRVSLGQAHVRPMALQDAGILQELESLATTGRLANLEPAFTNHHLSTRFLKRRFASLLGRIPLLTYSPALAQKKSPESDHRSVKMWKGYTASRSPAGDVDARNRAHDASMTDVAWFQWAADQEEKAKKAAKSKAKSKAAVLQTARTGICDSGIQQVQGSEGGNT